MNTLSTVEHKGVVGNTKTTTLRSRGWCWTLPNYKDEDYEKMKDFGHSCTLKFIIGKEIAPTTGTPHLQGYFYFKNPQTFDRMKKVCANAHWERSKGSPEANYEYCKKEGEFVAKGMEKEETFKEKLNQKLLSRYESVEWKPWQKSILDIVESKPDSRTINWVVDELGNSGKSFLTKYLALTKSVIIADGKKDNIFNQVNRKLNDDEEEFEIVILDIPRSSLGYVNYGVLEQLKNGCIYSGKYEGGLCLFDDVHVIVFANEEPDLGQFSSDRWNIIKI